jgi:hypothetical protein
MAYSTSPQSTGQSSSGLQGASTASTDKTAPANPYGSAGRSNSGTLPDKKIEESRSKSLNGDNAPLKFPDNLSSEYYISFNAFTHALERPAEAVRSFTFKKSINLPLPGNLSDSYSAAYNAENLYFAGNAAKEAVSNFISESGGIVNGLENLAKPDLMAKKLSEAMKAINPEKLLKVGAAGAIQGISGLGGPLGAAAKSTLQLTTNPFPVMIFQGTSFKPDFTFDWTLYPESLQEYYTIQKIIGFFRREMLPEKMPLNDAILKTPSIFEIKMVPEASLRMFKRCVLKNMNINYAPNGPSFIRDLTYETVKVPSSISFSLTFQEIEIWLADDYYPYEETLFAPKG